MASEGRRVSGRGGGVKTCCRVVVLVPVGRRLGAETDWGAMMRLLKLRRSRLAVAVAVGYYLRNRAAQKVAVGIGNWGDCVTGMGWFRLLQLR